nr:uncharacterized protein LOC108082150 [Drosophila kikkawai]
MCKGLTRKGFCYLTIGMTYSAGVVEISHGFSNLNKDAPMAYKTLLKAVIITWVLILIVGIFLIVGTCLPDSHRRSKRVLLRIWVFFALVFGVAISCIKVATVVHQWQEYGIERNIVRSLVICFFLVLLVFMMYFPCQYVQELEDEIDF